MSLIGPGSGWLEDLIGPLEMNAVFLNEDRVNGAVGQIMGLEPRAKPGREERKLQGHREVIGEAKPVNKVDRLSHSDA
jgi:hypothetical protein